MEYSPLFITRKRKKWKFAHFNEWSNCFNKDEVDPRQWQQPLTVEVGAGTADLSIQLARHYPERQFVAVDIKSDRLYTGAKIALNEPIKNINFVRAQAQQLPEVFLPRNIRELWITFPDPYPRKRQAKHRLTHPQFLQLYRHLLTPDGVVRFKTDNRELFLWSLEQIVAEGWQIKELYFDLHESNAIKDYKLTTVFERRFLREGTPINYVSFIPLGAN